MNDIKYVVISQLGIKYKLPKPVNSEDLQKLYNIHNKTDLNTLYIICETLGFERIELEETEKNIYGIK